MGNTMEQELERIFRVMALLLPHAGLHDAYVGLRSSNPMVRGNAIEFLDNVLKPELRQLLVPLLDSSVTVEERIALADTLVGAPLETPSRRSTTLLASEDAWLRSCAVYADRRTAARWTGARAGSLRAEWRSRHATDGSAGAPPAGGADRHRHCSGAGARVDGRRRGIGIARRCRVTGPLPELYPPERRTPNPERRAARPKSRAPRSS